MSPSSPAWSVNEPSDGGRNREDRYMAVKEGWKGRFYEDFEVGDVYRHPSP